MDRRSVIKALLDRRCTAEQLPSARACSTLPSEEEDEEESEWTKVKNVFPWSNYRKLSEMPEGVYVSRRVALLTRSSMNQQSSSTLYWLLASPEKASRQNYPLCDAYIPLRVQIAEAQRRWFIECIRGWDHNYYISVSTKSDSPISESSEGRLLWGAVEVSWVVLK